MITITFDEQGNFENTNLGGLIFIAGLLYDDKGHPDDTELERKRIYKYYNAVCEKAGTDYPMDLHVDNGNDSRVAQTKTVVGRTLGSFLKSGGFSDPEDDTDADCFGLSARKGTYYLFVKLRSEKGRKDYLGQNTSSMIKDSYASNLYVHMAEECIDELVFHNPVVENITEVFFDLPTRIVHPEGSKVLQYSYLDYRQYNRISPEVGENRFQIGNEDVYRTAVQQGMQDPANRKIKIKDFEVNSIRYSDNERNSMSFLHLADSICSLIGFKPSTDKPCEWIKEVRRTYKELTGHDHNLVFAYDDADMYWQNAYKAYEKNDIFESLNALYDGYKFRTSMTEFYADTWYQMLEKRIAACRNLHAFETAAKKLQASTYTETVEQERILYCFEKLKDASVNFENLKEASNALYALYDAGISAYNHTGQSEKALECLDKCGNAAKGQGLDQYVRTRNRLAVAYCDQLDFEAALKTAADTIFYEEQLKELRQLMTDNDTADADSEGRAYSQRAQVYSFMRNPAAENDFQKALEIFSSEKGDYLITLSYLLQYYLDMNEKEKYEKYARIYFRSSDLYEQFANLITDGTGKHTRTNFRFSLFIFVKAVWSFYRDGLTAQMKNVMLNMESALTARNGETRNMMNSHPWELIYKYLAFYAWYSGNGAKAEEYIKRSQTANLSKGRIIEQINENNLKEYERLKKGEDIIDPESRLTYMYR